MALCRAQLWSGRSVTWHSRHVKHRAAARGCKGSRRLHTAEGRIREALFSAQALEGASQVYLVGYATRLDDRSATLVVFTDLYACQWAPSH